MEHVIDRVSAYLQRDEQVPPELAAELLLVLSPQERTKWLRMAVGIAQEVALEIEFWEDHYGEGA